MKEWKMKVKNWFQVTEQKKSVVVDMGIIAAVIGVLVLIAYQVNGIYPFGEESIARGDMVQQTIPAGMCYVWDVLHGKASPFFAWDSAFGMNISGASSLGAFMSPLNLFLYFTTRDNIVDFANILLILKMIAIAWVMYGYLKKYNNGRLVQIIGGIVYAFGAASLVHFQIIMVMDAAFMLVLVMWGAERIFENKGCKFFIAMLALTMMVNVYTGAMILVFLFLSCGMRLFVGGEKRERKEKQRIALQLGISVVVGVMLSAVVVIPALMCISHTPRTANGTILETYKGVLQSQWRDYEWKTVERMLVNLALPLGCAAVFLLFGKEKIGKQIAKHRYQWILLLLMVISVWVPAIELLWHGGSRASWPVRFIYMISFVLVDLAVSLYEEKKEECFAALTWKKQGLAFGIAGVGALISGIIFGKFYESYCQHEKYFEWQDGMLCIVMEIIFFVLYVCALKIGRKSVVLCLLCIQLACTSIFSLAPNKDNGQVWSPQYLKAAQNVAKTMDTEIKDFERIKNTDYLVDHIEYSLVLGEESISNYWHVIPTTLQPKFSALGYSINWTQLLDCGGTIFTDTLYQIRYYLSKEKMSETLYEHREEVEGYDSEALHLYQNRFSLPFAINTNQTSLPYEYERFSLQNALFTIVTGSQTPLIQDVTGQMAYNTYNLQVGAEKKILYFYGTNPSSEPITAYVNGKQVMIPSSSGYGQYTYPSDFCNGIVCLGAFENQQVTVQFSGNTSGVRLGVLDYNTFVSGLEAVEKTNPKVTSLKQKKSGLKLQLTGVTKSNILLPVTYDEGWSCRVNGKQVETVNSVAGMVSIPVPQGDVRIDLCFTPPGQRMGAIISMVGLLLLIGFVLINKKKPLEETKGISVLSVIAYGIYGLAFAAFVIIVFVIPLGNYLSSSGGAETVN